MRTTIRLDDGLLRRTKEEAAKAGMTLTAVIENALRQALSHRAPAPRRRPVRLTTFRGNGVLPGVDLDNTAALLDLMEDRDPR